ncbi:MAG: hypothetical protein DHS20C05_24940 [Hyphococcus sp.]|nr:MAG: hypothetical protein DHS20C05_24940 [Marinicaulis sp.]
MKGRRDPTLIIHDALDSEVSFEHSKVLSDLNDDTSLIKTSGPGHRRILNDDHVVAQTVSFVRG